MAGTASMTTEALERALLQHRTGDLTGATELCRAILAGDQHNSGALNLLGVIEAQLGRHREALSLFDRAIEADPVSDAPYSNRGNVLGALGDVVSASVSYECALSIRPDYAEAFYNRASLQLAAGRTEAGLIGIGRALACRPDYPEAFYVRGNVLQANGFADAALRSYEGVLRLWPGHPETLTNRASVLLGIGMIDGARVSLMGALAVRPDLPEAWCNLGHAFLESRNLTVAMRALDRALAIASNYPTALTNRGNALTELGRLDEAQSSYDRAIAIRPDDALTYYNYGNALWRRKRHRASRVSLEKALALDPGYVAAWTSHGALMREMKRLDRMRSSFGRMMAVGDNLAKGQPTRIFAAEFFPELGFAEHQKARRDWFQQHPARPASVALRHANTPDPAKRLVLGYVSADFRAHATATLFGPVLRRHDRRKFELVCYSNVAVEDRITEEFRQLSDRWRAVAAISDDRLVEMVRADGVDILVDLSGHTVGNRLLVFAQKPAPVQVTAWGHITGTGIPAIDYLFADPVLIPPSVRPLFAEKIWDLPCGLSFELPDYTPAVTRRAHIGDTIVFGCLNRFDKVSEHALLLWAEILAAVPRSRLLLKDAALDDPEMRTLVTQVLASRGVAADRVDFRGSSRHLEHLQTYNEIDIALDPFPQNGGLSTWEALWMGRPVVAKLGKSAPGTASAAILTSIGMTDWIAATDRAYVDIAVAHASDRDALDQVRDGLRARISASAAGNPETYTRAVEQAYRAMWREWCATAVA